MFDRLRLYLKYDIYNHEDTDDLFLRSVKKNIAYHRKHCSIYDTILSNQRYRTNDLKEKKDLARIPFLTTMYLKNYTLACMNGCPPGYKILSMSLCRLPVKAVSSGTSGTRSFVGINTKLLFYAAVMTFKMMSYHNIFSWKPANYIILGFEPHKSNDTMISKTQRATTFFAPPKQREYVLKYRNNGYVIDFKGIVAALKKYSKQKSPVRIVGFPAYAFFLLRQLKQEHTSFRFPDGSMVLLGGGWKEFYNEKVEKEVLYRLIEEMLGIPETNCHEFFGAAEHPVLYCSCPNHHFHVPNYSRVIIRDIETLQPVKNGETGLVNLLTPAADSMPLTSIMTDDLGVLRNGTDCGCKIKTPYLELIGRAGMKEIKTCAMDAADFFKDGR